MGFTTIKFLLLSEIEIPFALAVLLASIGLERAPHCRLHGSFINRREKPWHHTGDCFRSS